MYLNQTESRNPKNTGQNNQCQAVSARMICGTEKLCSVRHWLNNKHGCHWATGLNGSEKNIPQGFCSTVTWCHVTERQEPITQWCGISRFLFYCDMMPCHWTSGTYYPVMWHHIPEEWKPQPHPYFTQNPAQRTSSLRGMAAISWRWRKLNVDSSSCACSICSYKSCSCFISACARDWNQAIHSQLIYLWLHVPNSGWINNFIYDSE